MKVDYRANGNTIEIIFHRELKYLLLGELITDSDMATISGFTDSAFMPYPLGNPIIAPLLPFGEHFYAPDDIFAKMYKSFVKNITKQKIKNTHIKVDDHKVVMMIEF